MLASRVQKCYLGTSVMYFCLSKQECRNTAERGNKVTLNSRGLYSQLCRILFNILQVLKCYNNRLVITYNTNELIVFINVDYKNRNIENIAYASCQQEQYSFSFVSLSPNIDNLNVNKYGKTMFLPVKILLKRGINKDKNF